MAMKTAVLKTCQDSANVTTDEIEVKDHVKV
jgi:hypothetical protein